MRTVSDTEEFSINLQNRLSDNCLVGPYMYQIM